MPNRKPSIHQLKPAPGYEDVTFELAVVPPTVFEQPAEVLKDERIDVTDGHLKPSTHQITRDDVHDALMCYKSKKRFLSGKSLRNIRVFEIVNKHILHYSLESYAEKRFLNWNFEPSKGEPAEAPPTSPAPGPWELEVDRPVSGLFKDGLVTLEVPNTSHLGVCHECVGIGRTRCDDCKGDGGEDCLRCQGSGTCRSGWGQIKCKGCNGSGRLRCKECKGHGQVKCDICKKKCRLRYSVTLTVQRTNHVNHSLANNTDIPDKILISTEGDVVWEIVDKMVYPIRHLPDDFLITASEDLIKKHECKLVNERILHQRQRVRSIPVAEVRYLNGQKTGHFYVHGLEKKVHVPKRNNRSTTQRCSLM